MITLINGFPQGPNGLIVPNGSISFQLNTDATVIAAPNGFVAADVEVVFQFNAAGQIQPNAPATSAQIWSNLELNPQNASGLGTYYLTTFYDQSGARLNKVPMWWQFITGNGTTVDISQMTAYMTVGGNVIFYPIPNGGSGTVTSVAFVGDGTVLSSTPSTPVTTAGNISAALLTQSAHAVLVGPTSGSAALPTFRTLVSSDLPSVTLAWSSLVPASADLILANTIFNTTFTQTTATNWKWANITAATVTVPQNSPTLSIAGTYWTGSASAADTWSFQDSIAAGTNPKTILMLSHSGSSGTALFQVPNLFVSGDSTMGTVESVITSIAGSVALLTSAANASAGHTPYQGNFAGAVLPAGATTTIAGFGNAGNNGTFIVVSCNSSSVTVLNSGGIAETASATSTAASPPTISVGNIFFSGQGRSSTFAIQGTVYPVEVSLAANVGSLPLVLGCNGDPNDAVAFNIFAKVNGDHGFQLASIIDATGANPAFLTMANVGGVPIVGLTMPDTLSGFTGSATTLLSATAVGTMIMAAANGSGGALTFTLTGSGGAVANCNIKATTLSVTAATPTGAAGTLSFGTTTSTSASTGANGDVPAQVVGYISIDIAGTKYKVPYYNV